MKKHTIRIITVIRMNSIVTNPTRRYDNHLGSLDSVVFTIVNYGSSGGIGIGTGTGSGSDSMQYGPGQRFYTSLGGGSS